MQEICPLKRLIFTSKCTKNAFGGRAPPELAGGGYSVTPGPLPGLREKERGVEKGKGQGRPKAPPDDTKCVTEILVGTKIRKLGK